MTRFLWFNRLRVMTRKELLQLGRDTALLLFIIYGFVFDVYLAGAGFTFELRNAPFVLLDNDRSEFSRELTGRFNEPIFRFVADVQVAEEAMGFLDRGKALAGLEIPQDFYESLREGRQTEVQINIDATNNVPALLFSGYAEQIISDYGFEAAGMYPKGFSGSDIPTLPQVDDQVRVWFNSNLKDSWFMAVIELFTIISILSIMLPAAAYVREKEKGTIEQLRVSPLSPMLIIMPKILSMTLVILGGTFVSIFFVIHPFFDMPLHGNLPVFFLVTALYAFATAGIGIAAASIVRTQGQVAMLVVLLVMPMLLLSGSWTPPEAMPDIARKIMIVSPLYHYFEAGLGIIFRDAGLGQIWHSILGLSAIGAIAFGFGLWHVKR